MSVFKVSLQDSYFGHYVLRHGRDIRALLAGFSQLMQGGMHLRAQVQQG